MLLACKLMLDWLGESDRALTLENALAKVIAKGEVRTYDLGGTASTLEMAEAVVQAL